MTIQVGLFERLLAASIPKNAMTVLHYSATLDALRQFPFVSAVYLFGSHAKGTARPYSDVDLCVVAERPLSLPEKGALMACASKKVDVRIFSDLPPRIRFSVLREGRLLYCRSPLPLHRAEVRSLLEYLDLQPMVQRFLGPA